MQKPIIIGIAGGTGSGKTSVANAILEDLMKNGDDVVLLEQDSYYKKNDHLSFSERVKLNYDHPNSIDFDLLEEHIKMLGRNESIDKPIYNFAEHNRTKEIERIDSKSIIIVEGILILAIEKIRNLLDMKIFVDTDDDIRLLRRMERDIQERGRSFDNVKEQYISTVKPMHLEFVEPSKRYADVIIPRGKDNEVGIKMVSSRLKYLIRRSATKESQE
ncbi:uridine kinase [Streptobacillus canis]|uniref:uridine kinase n=1 Tax=Streptobacillus canis TaxID=2678686 RepID=UPI0038B63438